MQPFGLFNFLQSLLDLSANSSQKSEKQTPDESAAASPNEFPCAHARDNINKNPTDETPSTNENALASSPPTNPCAEFIRRHDERASRTRKK